MTTLHDLLAQKAEIETQIAEIRTRELADAVANARALIDQYGITAEDVFGRKGVGKKSGKVAIKFRNPASGATWTPEFDS